MTFFSIVICTLGRDKELDNLLQSVFLQNENDYEVFVVDQNKDGKADEICSRWKSYIPLTHLRCEPGASASRNYGINHAKGVYTLFPDDDAELPMDYLSKLRIEICKHNCAVLIGKLIDRASGRPSLKNWPIEEFDLVPKLIWKVGNAAALTIRFDLLKACNGFDENLGPGTIYGAQEDCDLILRAIYSGESVKYTPNIFVYHPDQSFNGVSLSKIKSYSRGTGALVAKHLFYYKQFSLFFVALFAAFRSTAGLVLAFISKNVRERGSITHRIANLKGLATGFVLYAFSYKR